MRLPLPIAGLLTTCLLQPLSSLGQKLPEIPSHLQAWSQAVDWHSPKRTFVTVESRRPADPASAKELGKARSHVLQTLHGMAFPVVADRDKAELELSLILDPHVRYGTFHYENAPYVYLLVRDRVSGQLGYCAYRRLSRISNQTDALLAEWREVTARQSAPASGSLEDCAAQAMRPVH